MEKWESKAHTRSTADSFAQKHQTALRAIGDREPVDHRLMGAVNRSPPRAYALGSDDGRIFKMIGPQADASLRLGSSISVLL